jgi:hypothetical protein
MRRRVILIGLFVATAALASPAGAASRHTLRGTFTLSGQVVTLTGDRSIDIKAPLEGADIAVLKGDCSGIHGYDDLAEGAAVVVKNDKGRTIANTQLGAGTPATGACTWTFKTSVPDASFYAVTVSHRGEITYSKKQLTKSKWAIALSLGS